MSDDNPADDTDPALSDPTERRDESPGTDTEDEETPELPGDTEGRSGPLRELADRVEEQRGTQPDDAFDDLFEDTGEASVDSDALWEQVGGDETFETDVDEAEPDRTVVDKRKYCQSCEYFSEPPDVACTHQGTEILEVVDADCFEVFNCPVVRENENLENL